MTQPNVFTIPAGAPFVDTLAAGIIDRFGAEPLALAAITVLLPTRRACRELRDAFLRQADGRPLLLPRLAPLGDLDADALGLGLEELPALAGSLDLPPPLPGLRRQLLLARTIAAVPGLAANIAQAARLAGDLARFLDQMQTERLGFEALATLVPEDYASHWQVTLRFLSILTESWPAILAEEAALDSAERRNRILTAQAALWQAKPPAEPVIAAGTTGSIPATADLLAVIASLPQGAVVLPGLDDTLDEAAWAQLDETHPQFNLAHLLDRRGSARAAVRPWRADSSAGQDAYARPGTGRPDRRRLLAEVMRPAATTEDWRGLAGGDGDAGDEVRGSKDTKRQGTFSPDTPYQRPAGLWKPGNNWEETAGSIEAAALRGLGRIDCANSAEEAGVIALLLRRTLELPDRTAAVITPDRTLARRVAAAMTRWGVAIDDSGGVPLPGTAVGSFLLLLAECVGQRCAPLPLLALLKHPLAAGGRSPGDFRSLARALERAALRGPRPAEGLAGIAAALEHASDSRFQHADGRTQTLAWLDELGTLLAPLTAAMGQTAVTLTELVRAHVAVAETLAATAAEPGPARLWRRDDGEAAAAFFNELFTAANDFPAIEGGLYPALLDTMMAGQVVRPRYGRHPRLAILGPLEARLVRADLVILAGLNEGTWPAEPAPDPWLSRPMRRALGLPVPERQIGLAAHDFVQGCAGPEVVLTRADRVDGAPTVPSRWLSRLDTVLRAAGLDAGLLSAEGAVWLGWLRGLDEPDQVQPVRPPEPRPPVAARPRTLSVTAVETWMRDPYAIFARHILGLIRLEPIAALPGPAERGQFFHQALDAFVRRFPTALPADEDTAFAALLACGRTAFGPLLASPEVWAFWWPAFERAGRWFLTTERDHRKQALPLATEVSGSLVLSRPGFFQPFTLKAKADRIDRLREGPLAIIDYKTGEIPSAKQIALGFAPQLPLEAAIAEAGGFSTIAAQPVAALEFWRLSGGDPPGKKIAVKESIPDLAGAAREGLECLIQTFDNPATPYYPVPRPDFAPRFSDYQHLARVQEWSAGGDDGEGE